MLRIDELLLTAFTTEPEAFKLDMEYQSDGKLERLVLCPNKTISPESWRRVLATTAPYSPAGGIVCCHCADGFSPPYHGIARPNADPGGPQPASCDRFGNLLG